MSKIYELPISYRLVRRYIKYTFKEYFDEITIRGIENLPADAPIIFAPNFIFSVQSIHYLSCKS